VATRRLLHAGTWRELYSDPSVCTATRLPKKQQARLDNKRHLYTNIRKCLLAGFFMQVYGNKTMKWTLWLTRLHRENAPRRNSKHNSIPKDTSIANDYYTTIRKCLLTGLFRQVNDRVRVGPRCVNGKGLLHQNPQVSAPRRVLAVVLLQQSRSKPSLVAYLSMYLSMYLSLSISFYLSVYLSIYVYLCLSIHLSIYLYIYYKYMLHYYLNPHSAQNAGDSRFCFPFTFRSRTSSARCTRIINKCYIVLLNTIRLKTQAIHALVFLLRSGRAPRAHDVYVL